MLGEEHCGHQVPPWAHNFNSLLASCCRQSGSGRMAVGNFFNNVNYFLKV